MNDVDIRTKLLEFKGTVDAILGYSTTITESGTTRAKLEVKTPNGEIFGQIDCFWAEQWGCWHFGGVSSFLPKLWSRLSDIGRET